MNRLLTLALTAIILAGCAPQPETIIVTATPEPTQEPTSTAVPTMAPTATPEPVAGFGRDAREVVAALNDNGYHFELGAEGNYFDHAEDYSLALGVYDGVVTSIGLISNLENDDDGTHFALLASDMGMGDNDRGELSSWFVDNVESLAFGDIEKFIAGYYTLASFEDGQLVWLISMDATRLFGDS